MQLAKVVPVLTEPSKHKADTKSPKKDAKPTRKIIRDVLKPALHAAAAIYSRGPAKTSAHRPSLGHMDVTASPPSNSSGGKAAKLPTGAVLYTGEHADEQNIPAGQPGW